MTQADFDYLLKVVIIGDSGVGKTNLLNRFIDDSFIIDSRPTVGVEFATKTLNIQKNMIKTQIWDTAGQQRFRALTNAYYRGAQGAIIVYDLTRPKSFQSLSRWLSELREHAKSDITIMVCGNKSDLDQRSIGEEEIKDFMVQNKLFYLQTSAKNGENVDEAFTHLVKEIYNKMKKQEEPEPVIPDKKEKEKKKPQISSEKKPQPSIVLDQKPEKPHKPRKRCCN